jgi:hypothetical protein
MRKFSLDSGTPIIVLLLQKSQYFLAKEIYFVSVSVRVSLNPSPLEARFAVELARL